MEKRLLPFVLALNDCNVTINGRIVKSLGSTAGQRPFYFHPINFFAVSQTQNDAWIVRGKIAAPSNLRATALQVPSLVADLGADRIWITPFTDQANSQPVVMPGRIVTQKQRSSIIYGDQDVDSAVVIKITD